MNNGAYQHFLRVSNDCCETSLQRILEGQSRRVIVLNGSLPGMVLPVCFSRILCHLCTLDPGLEIGKNKEMCFGFNRNSTNHWGRQEKRKEGRKEGKKKDLVRGRE